MMTSLYLYIRHIITNKQTTTTKITITTTEEKYLVKINSNEFYLLLFTLKLHQ